MKKISERAGDPAIFYSCDGLGDFGRYKIESFVDKFVAVKLSNPAPYTSREHFERFEKEVVGDDPDRIAAFERLRKARFGDTIVIIDFAKRRKQKNSAKGEVRKWMVKVRTAEHKFLALLAPEERKRYRLEAKPWIKSGHKSRKTEPRQIDIAAAKRWVAKEAYGFGWNKKRFEHEVERYDDYSRNRPLVERIGKKYQWLALSDLLCRLADNYWVGGILGSPTRKYDTPIDIGFLRDIDPTILPRISGEAHAQGTSNAWMLGPEIVTPATPEAELTLWPFSCDLGETFPRLISRLDPEGTDWITLYDHRTVTTRYGSDTGILHGYRQQEFRFVFCVLVKQADAAQFVDYFKSKRTIDVHMWQPPELTDGPYLRETPWRTTWPRDQWEYDGWRTPKNLPVAFPVCDYLWESHLDVSLPEGAQMFVPSPWLTVDLGLSADPSEISIYRDATGTWQFRSSRRGMAGSSAVIGAEILTGYLSRRRLQCLWLFVAERGVWPGGHNDNAAWRRTEGFCLVENGKPTAVTWNEDRVNAP